MRESRIEKAVCEVVKSLGGWALKFTSPGNRAVPDRLCLLPGGIVFFVECKAPQKKLRKLQLYVRGKIEGLGFSVYVVKTLKDVEEFKEEIEAFAEKDQG